ncbi:hemagglutinin [Archangium violaceum]|uniref:adventurous gliding motility protein AgmC n=1 Tax=Archangium violaceum TaxID=83451 RepID=UPI002B2C7D45|nr:hemagglutinin [Archangium violaceum]
MPTILRRFFSDRSSRFPLGLLSLVFALFPTGVLAEADVFGLGNGQHGSLQVKAPGVVLNASTALASEALAGATELRVENSVPFDEGELVMVLQMGGEALLPVYRETPLELGDSGVGRWELARLSKVSPGVLRLTAPLVNRFVLASQVVRVPEYTEVHIQSSGSLVAQPWNGRSGGVLALLVTGLVNNQGSLDVDGAGFRGGEAEVGVALDSYECAAPDGVAGAGGSSAGGASKGEGFASVLSGAPTHGYGLLANGGGGGNCHDAGGGGGGHIGKGGRGGRSAQETMEREVGGLGGAALRYASPLERLLFGGGGGAGIEGSSGGRGGGILFVRAREIQSPRPRGILTANGLAASSAVGLHGGGGGGGAGGTVHVRVAETLGCTVLSAKGGAGADSDTSPGGGGGGGLLLVQASEGVPPDCEASVSAGLSGYTSVGSRGAEPIVAGQPEFDGSLSVIVPGFAVPPVPTWLSPGAGAAGVEPLPRFEGKTAPGATVQVFLDGEPLGAPVVADDSGGFVAVPSAELAEGPHEVRAWAEQLGVRSATSEPLGFSVGSLLGLRVGCGCGAVSAGGAWGLGLAVLAWVWLRGAARRGG